MRSLGQTPWSSPELDVSRRLVHLTVVFVGRDFKYVFTVIFGRRTEVGCAKIRSVGLKLTSSPTTIIALSCAWKENPATIKKVIDLMMSTELLLNLKTWQTLIDASSKSTRSPAACCFSNDVSVWVAPAFIKSNGKKRRKTNQYIASFLCF